MIRQRRSDWRGFKLRSTARTEGLRPEGDRKWTRNRHCLLRSSSAHKKSTPAIRQEPKPRMRSRCCRSGGSGGSTRRRAPRPRPSAWRNSASRRWLVSEPSTSGGRSSVASSVSSRPRGRTRSSSNSGRSSNSAGGRAAEGEVLLLVVLRFEERHQGQGNLQPNWSRQSSPHGDTCCDHS